MATITGRILPHTILGMEAHVRAGPIDPIVRAAWGARAEELRVYYGPLERRILAAAAAAGALHDAPGVRRLIDAKGVRDS